ncbi:MAG: hypothetical protein OXL96_21140 [Candidatus Poribacteria bacterium]|nr:hypothetical protein [Candidatus Poribacteria bacterium]
MLKAMTNDNLKGFMKAVFGRQPRKQVGEAQEDMESSRSSTKRSGLTRAVPQGMEHYDKVRMQHTRLARQKDVRAMIATNSTADRMLFKLGLDASLGGVSVEVQNTNGVRNMHRAQQVIDRTRFLIKDEMKLKGWVEALLRDGDLFLQMLVTEMPREVETVKKLAAEITHSNMNSEGNFPKDKTAYYQTDTVFNEKIIRTFDEWEIAHVKWRDEDGKPYGIPLLASARLAYRRLESGEQNMSIRRTLAAGFRELINIGTEDDPGTPSEMKHFREENENTFNDPQNPFASLFGNGRVSAESLKTDVNLSDIDDVDYFKNSVVMAGLSPSGALPGFEKSAPNYAVIDMHDLDYNRTIQSLAFLMEGGYNKIFELAFLLSGIDPAMVKLLYSWGSKDREAQEKKFLYAKYALEIGASVETAWRIADWDGYSYDEEIQKIQAQIEAGVIPYRGVNLSPIKSRSAEPFGTAGGEM